MKKWIGLILILILLSGCSADQEVISTGDNSEDSYLVSDVIPMTESNTGEVEDLAVSENIEEIPALEPADETESVEEPIPEAVEILEGVAVYYKDWNCSNILFDKNHGSKMSVSNAEALRIESEMPFGAIYIEWDAIPGEFILSWDGGELLCGQEGFLHDYIPLPEEITCIYISFPDKSYRMLCDVRLFTAGKAPAGVQDWNEPTEYADILVFPTHSDDESLFFGPLIAYYAIERKMNVQTAFMVDHAGYPVRSHERLNALWELGVRSYPIVWTAPDTDQRDLNYCLSYYSRCDVLGWQIEMIRRFKPLVVVGHDLDGEYGNGGHKVNAYYLTQAVDLAADESVYEESAQAFGVWDTPKYYIHLYEENSWKFDVNLSLTADAAGRSPFEIAEDAFEYHKSQHGYGFHVKQNDEQPWYDCRPFGLYRSLVGLDSTADVMENIDVDRWR